MENLGVSEVLGGICDSDVISGTETYALKLIFM